MAWPRFSAGIKLSGADFVSILDTYGDDTLVRRTARCGCIDPETRKPDVMCDTCHGFGWQYPAEIELTVKVQWTGSKKNPREHPQGDITPGDYTATWFGHAPGLGDVFVHPREALAVHEVLLRGAVASSAVGAPSLEYLAHRVVLAIEHVADDGHVYEEGVDFSLGGDGRTIEWEAGRGPAVGVPYTIRYTARGEYIIGSEAGITVRHDGSETLPYKVTLHRYDPAARQPGRNLTDP